MQYVQVPAKNETVSGSHNKIRTNEQVKLFTCRTSQARKQASAEASISEL